MNDKRFKRRAFLLGAGAAGINIALAFETLRQSGLFQGVDEAADAKKSAYEREQLKLHTLEGHITDANGQPMTGEPAGEGAAAPVLDPAFGSICGMRTKRFGSSGLRQLYESELCYAEVPHAHGATITTTLNGGLQKAAYALTAGFRGCAALLDIDTGAVVALADRPSSTEFDANNVTAETMERWNNEPNFWYPPSTTCCLQPGSVQKIIDAAAIIASGIPQEYTDTGVSATGIRNAGQAVYGGPLNVTDMLRLSINTYAADVTCRVPGEVFSQTLDNFFFNHSLELDFGKVLRPTVNFDQNAPGSWAQICIGHGPIQTAPLHLALIIGACLHPEGQMILPFMVRELTRQSGCTVQHEDGGNVFSTPLPDAGVRQQLVDALVVTADGYHLSVPGGIVLAKTGTATIENSDRANVFLAFALQTSRGRRFGGVFSRENVTGSSAQLKPVCQEFISHILAEEDNIK